VVFCSNLASAERGVGGKDQRERKEGGEDNEWSGKTKRENAQKSAPDKTHYLVR
jgi:hypothetical protein